MADVEEGIRKALAESGWEAVNLVGSSILGPAWKILAPTAKALVEFKSPADVAMATLTQEWAAAEREATERATRVRDLVRGLDESEISKRLVVVEALSTLNTRARRWQLFTKLHHAAIAGIKFQQAIHTTDSTVRDEAIEGLYYRCVVMGIPGTLAERVGRGLSASDITVETARSVERVVADWIGANHSPLCMATWIIGRAYVANQFGEDYSPEIDNVWTALELPPSLLPLARDATKTSEATERFCRTLAGHL